MTKEILYSSGVDLMRKFCEQNHIPPPSVKRLTNQDRAYFLGACAFYRPSTISIMVEKCAHLGTGGRAWSWPAYAIDRTPYGVIQHELGHHVDNYFSRETLFSKKVYSGESPLTGYLGTDKSSRTFYVEWFAENFRLFVTNPSLCLELKPQFYNNLLSRELSPLTEENWKTILQSHSAPDRIINQAQKKINYAH